jgi:hypothetical protein
MAVATWVRPVFAVYGVTMAVFFLIQYIFHIPEGSASAGFQAPYEDISLFSSITDVYLRFFAAIPSDKKSLWPTQGSDCALY